MSKSQKRKKKWRYSANFDQDEALIFKQNIAAWETSTQASNYGDSIAAYIRYSTIGAGAPKLRKRRSANRHLLPAEKLLLQLKAEVNRVGNNINQIAHQMNMGNAPPSPQVQKALSEWQAVSQAINTHLGIDPNNP